MSTPVVLVFPFPDTLPSLSIETDATSIAATDATLVSVENVEAEVLASPVEATYDGQGSVTLQIARTEAEFNG